MNVFYFVSFNEPLELWLHAKKKKTKEMVLLKISISRVPMGQPAAADEIQTKNKKYDTQQKCLFLP